jgi:hypothetical protein
MCYFDLIVTECECAGIVRWQCWWSKGLHTQPHTSRQSVIIGTDELPAQKSWCCYMPCSASDESRGVNATHCCTCYSDVTNVFNVYVCVCCRADLSTLKSEMTKVKAEADVVVKQV